GRKDEPLAVGRPTVPGIHPRGVALQPASLAPFGRNDVEFAVGLQAHETLRLAADNPLATGRQPGEIVAHAVVRGAFQRLRPSAPPLVERNPIEIKAKRLPFLEKLLTLLLRKQNSIAAGPPFQCMGLGTRKDDLLPVGAPGGVALDELRVVRAG